VFFQIGGLPQAVKQENAAVLQIGKHVVFVHIGRVVAGHKVGHFHQVGGTDGLFAKPQMGLRNAARLFGVVGEIRLGVKVGVVANDFNGVFVGAHRAVRTQAPEFGAVGAFGGHVHIFTYRQRMVRHVVHNAHGKVVGGLVLF